MSPRLIKSAWRNNKKSTGFSLREFVRGQAQHRTEFGDACRDWLRRKGSKIVQ